jgi:hypothetical protein
MHCEKLELLHKGKAERKEDRVFCKKQNAHFIHHEARSRLCAKCVLKEHTVTVFKHILPPILAQ